MQVTYDHLEDTAQNIKTFYFRPAQPLHYLAGQFTELRLPHKSVDDRGDKRWFTLSSAPSDDWLTITTKITAQPSSFKQTLLKLQPGTQLQFAEPMGDFVLPKDESIPLLFVAGGIGVTPFHSIVKELAAHHEQRDIALLYATSSPEEIAFKDLFEDYDMPTNYVTGKLTTEQILAMPNVKNRRIYISGPEPMVESLIEELYAAGITGDQLIGDYFPGYPAPSP